MMDKSTPDGYNTTQRDMVENKYFLAQLRYPKKQYISVAFEGSLQAEGCL